MSSSNMDELAKSGKRLEDFFKYCIKKKKVWEDLRWSGNYARIVDESKVLTDKERGWLKSNDLRSIADALEAAKVSGGSPLVIIHPVLLTC